MRRLNLLRQSLHENFWAKEILLSLYYLLIFAALIAMYGQGNFSTPDFIYQGF
ncbi:teichoic acid D-Ala incorporation-associated protein DltX [bacterium]|nr:teichoic acid D-Ala incorporation-associated protein DltX [bacterium]NCT21499.1 teichoic acid D-Ala incorporation-associated protein DltX [bacterium]